MPFAYGLESAGVIFGHSLECSSNSATAASESLLAVKSLREQYLLPPQVEATPGASGTSTQGSRTQANAPVNDDIFSMGKTFPLLRERASH